jgi:hypothetical protein
MESTPEKGIPLDTSPRGKWVPGTTCVMALGQHVSVSASAGKSTKDTNWMHKMFQGALLGFTTNSFIMTARLANSD